MPIVPGVEPVRDRTQVEPFKPLPTQQISSATQRLTDRLQKVRGAHHTLMSQIAKQEVLPQNQTQYELATRKVRENLNKLSEDDKYYNKLPQVRREARRFAQIAKGFKQNKKNVQESLKNLEEAEDVPDAQRAYLKRKILRGAPVQIKEDGTVEESTISSPRSFQSGQDPKDFLAERLSDVQPETRRSRTTQDGVIMKTEQDALTMRRLRQQGFKELGFAAQKDENGNLNLQKVSDANPKVDRWLQREKQVIASRVSQQVNPQENPEKFRRKVNQALEDEVINMVNTVSSRFKEVDDPETTIKNDPRFDTEDGGGSNSQTSTGLATVDAPFSARDEQAKKTQKTLLRQERQKIFDKNENIDRNTYSKIDKEISKIPSGRSELATSGTIAVPKSNSNRREQIKKLKQKYGPETIEAYQTIKSAEKNIKESVGEHAAQERSFEFNVGSKEYNEVERGIASMTPGDFKSENLNKDQLRYLLADNSNFQIVDIAQDMGWVRVKARNVADMPDSDNWIYRGKPQEGEAVTLKLNRDSLGGGREGQSSADRLMSHLPESAQRLAKYQQKVSGQGFGSDWEKVKGQSDVSMRMMTDSDTDFRVGKQPFAQRFEVKVGDEPLTFGKMSEAVINNESDEENFARTINELTRAAQTNLPFVKRLQRSGNLPPLEGQQIKRMMVQWHEDKSQMSDAGRELMDKIMNSPLPADRRGRGLMWADHYKSLK